MCGLFGVVGSFSHRTKKELTLNLSYLSTSRGADATGYALWKDNSCVIKKKAVSALEFGPGRCRYPVIMGHTRFATCGDADDSKQAHPFISRCKNFVLAHNGIAYDDFESLQETYQLECETPVDSEGILRFLEKDACSLEQIAKLYQKWTTSSFAISLLHTVSGKLSLFHNNRRPLFVAKFSEGFVYASTLDILQCALTESELIPIQIFSLEPFMVYELSNNIMVKTPIPLSSKIKKIHLSYGTEEEEEAEELDD